MREESIRAIRLFFDILASCSIVSCHFDFTLAQIFKDTFRTLVHVKPTVLYPIPNFAALDLPIDEAGITEAPNTATCVFLSINRYERKKNLTLALEALGKIFQPLVSAEATNVIVFKGIYHTLRYQSGYYVSSITS